MNKRWVLKEVGESQRVAQLSAELNINKHLSNLLVQRGIHTFDEAKEFFRPSLERLHDPFLMKDMDLAIQRIESAIANNQKILVYGDYDVDGTTAVALVYTFFKSVNAQLDFYIPDRYSEGYGISYQGIDYAADNGFSLIIALDCGIKATEKIDYASEKGIDFIIGDHHRPGDELPKAVAVLDPKRADCAYPYKELSGCGVGFKLVQAYAKKNQIPFEKLHRYLDLIVVSIASDIVPITGENRILAHYGLKLINSNPRPGFEAILKYSNVIRQEHLNKHKQIFNRELTVSDLVFLIGPRINAAGRIESGRNSVKLLIAEDIPAADKIGRTINEFNSERKNLDATATRQALAMINTSPRLRDSKSTVVYNKDWHKGVVGIVASRLTESFYRPTIVLTQSNDLITGSARSVKDFDIYDAIDSCSDLLEHFGGHKYAAGLSIKPENLETFTSRFEDVVAKTISDCMLVPEVEIDLKMDLRSITSKFWGILRQFAPFGPGNMAPIFVTDNVIADTTTVRIVGKNHLKMDVIHPDISSYPIPTIAFHKGDYFDYVAQGRPFKICYHLEQNDWNGHVTLQLNIKDIKIPLNGEGMAANGPR